MGCVSDGSHTVVVSCGGLVCLATHCVAETRRVSQSVAECRSVTQSVAECRRDRKFSIEQKFSNDRSKDAICQDLILMHSFFFYKNRL